MSGPPSVPPSSEKVLVRAIGFWALTASIINVTIGGSIFALPGTLAASLGAAAPLAFILGALLFVPITLCFAAAGSRATLTGGPYSYVSAAFGPFPGFVVAVFLWISSVSGSGSLAAILADQVGHVVPLLSLTLPRAAFMLAIYGLLIATNARGIRIGATLVMLFAIAKVLPLLVLGIAASGLLHWENFHITATPSWSALGSSLVIVVFAYSGIETALTPSGEVHSPSRTVPLAAMTGIAVVIALYVGLQWIAQGALGGSLAGNEAPLAAVADLITPSGGALLVLVAFVSLVGCIQGDLLGSSRLLYALARDGFLPAPFAILGTRSRAPLVALTVHALAAWALAAAGSFTTLALVSGGAFCLVYIACCGAAWRLQHLNVARERKPLRLPAGPLLPATAIVGLSCILLTLRGEDWRAITTTSIAICILYAVIRLSRRRPV
jgi:basic amino acid/polyamine antiporter, APA family